MSRAAFFGAATLVLAACGRSPGSTSVLELEQQGRLAGPARFDRADARSMVAHGGVRRLEFAALAGSGASFHERIVTDGHGQYSIEPLEALESSIPDWNGFELVQRVEEGFIFRYRDFVVREPQLFARNYRTTDLGQSVTVAGRSCDRYRVERIVGTPTSFELSVDHETQLVLACQEFDASGRRLSSMTYESLDLQPDTSAVFWHVPSNQERALDLASSLAQQLGRRVLEPRLLPAGYAPDEAATVDDGQGNRWLKLTYSDGVETLFFLQALDADGTGKAAHAEAPIGGVPRSTSAVVVFQVGAATVVQGQVNGFDLIVIGKEPKSELLDLIESSLP